MKGLPQRSDETSVSLALDARRSRKLLLIDDYDDTREVLACVLERLGHRVSTAATGLDGVDQALRSRPEISLIDIGLPDMDGYDVARVLRRVFGADVYLIAFTGYGRLEDRARAFEAGFDAHLTKPAEIARLEHVLGCGRDR